MLQMGGDGVLTGTSWDAMEAEQKKERNEAFDYWYGGTTEGIAAPADGGGSPHAGAGTGGRQCPRGPGAPGDGGAGRRAGAVVCRGGARGRLGEWQYGRG